MSAKAAAETIEVLLLGDAWIANTGAVGLNDSSTSSLPKKQGSWHRY